MSILLSVHSVDCFAWPAEIEFWRVRNAAFSSLYEQLNLPSVKKYMSVLEAGSADQNLLTSFKAQFSELKKVIATCHSTLYPCKGIPQASLYRMPNDVVASFSFFSFFLKGTNGIRCIEATAAVVVAQTSNQVCPAAGCSNHFLFALLIERQSVIACCVDRSPRKHETTSSS